MPKKGGIVHEVGGHAIYARITRPNVASVGLAAFCECLYDPGPGARKIAPVVTTAASSHNASVAMPVGQGAQIMSRLCMRVLGESQVGYRIAVQAVGTALHDDEFRPGIVQVAQHPRPDIAELTIAGLRRQRDIHFRPGCPALAGFAGGPRTRIQITTIFMDIGENQVRVILETIKNAIPVVGIDVDIGDPLQLMFLPQVLRRDATIIEDAKTRRVLPARVV